MPETPDIDCAQVHAELFVRDIPAAVDFYTTRLGFKPGFTWGEPPSMAGVNLGGVQMFLQRGTPNPAGCSVYFRVGDADALYDFHRANNIEILVELADRNYGLRDYRIRDLNGYELSFGHHLMETDPAIEIERVDVPVRIEKRLAGLLVDLAKYKRMSVNSCLEETLLHTLDGVAPHTKGDLRHIQKLKQQHGIDYDSHASYRFVEHE